MNINFANQRLATLINQVGNPQPNQPLIADNRLLKSMRSIQTRYTNNVFIDLVGLFGQNFIPTEITLGNVVNLMTELEGRISQNIKNNLSQPENVPLENFKELALLISFWGGGTALQGVNNREEGTHYLVSPGFDWEVYRNFFIDTKNLSQDPNLTPQNLTVFVRNQIRNIPGLGISFITKHLHFISKETNGTNKFPIYDTLIANNWFNCAPRDKDYAAYFNWVQLNSNELQVSEHDFERFLFNYTSNN